MSLTSCFRYILELPVNTLNLMLRSALSEDDSADIPISGTINNAPIGDKTATVNYRPSETDEPTLSLTATDLGLVVHMFMRLEADINEYPELDPLVYNIEFDLPGVFEREMTTPPRLVVKFPAVTEPALNLVVSGEEIVLTPALIEPRIHALYDSNPALAHDFQPDQPWIDLDFGGTPPGGTQVDVTTDIFDDDLSDPNFRGAITVEVPSATEIVLVMPGHINIHNPGQTYVESDMTLRISVEVVPTDGKILVKLSGVTDMDVTVEFDPTDIASTNPFYIGPLTSEIQKGVAQRMNDIGDMEELFPTDAEVKALISSQLITIASGLIIPLFTPQPPAAGEIDMTTFVPTTVNQQALALQLVPLGDGTPCDAPDLFTLPDGFAIAIAAVEVHAIMDPVFDDQEGDHTMQGYDMTVNSLTGTLANAGDHGRSEGHIWVEGEVEVHVDCWFDPTIAFEGAVTLTPSMDSDNTIVFTAHAAGFTADDPCCGDVDPADIEDLINEQKSTPVKMPSDFTDVGILNLGVTDAVISSAGIVVHGTLGITTTSMMHIGETRQTLYWFNDIAGGG